MIRVLFYRDFLKFTGGHLKVRHYFDHVRASPRHQALIAFSPTSRWDETNPWLAWRDQALPVWDPAGADLLFLAGMDWTRLPPAQRESPPRPVINLIQHVRHADPREALYDFLGHPAVRIGVSAPVTAALRATGRVQGPLFTISNGLDLDELPAALPWEQRVTDVLILGIKQPALAHALAEGLGGAGLRLETLTRPLPRPVFLAQLRQARVALLLPNRTEGFYLPALEAMALGVLVVCPDVLGNRTFCHPGVNCLQPPYDAEELSRATWTSLSLLADQRRALLAAGVATAQAQGLAGERAAFLAILEGITDLWRAARA